MFRRWIIGAVGTCLLSSMLLAKPGEVSTKGGDVYRGDITETSDGKSVLIKTGSIETKLDRRYVAKIQYLLSFEDQWAEKIAKLQPTDLASRIGLGRWAYESHRLIQARDIFEEALKIDPTNRDASGLLDMVVKQMDLEKKATVPAPDKKPPASAPATAPVSPLSPIIEKKVLTAQDINLIRQMELQPGELLRITFIGDVKKRYVAATGTDVVKWNSLSPTEQALKIINSGNPLLARDVRLIGDPMALKEYRQLQPTILTGCATSGCHGGAAAGNFVLYAPAGNEATDYTNFYVLQTYVKNNAAMLDRAAPDRSLLLQMGLPADSSTTAHPNVPGYKPIFKSRQDPRYERIANWLGKTLSVVQPNYGIEYPLATAPKPPTTQPEK